MTVSEYIFEYLSNRGCDCTYMVSGSSAMWLTDAVYKNNKMRAVCTHHEQAAAMAADGYARVNGKPGICLVTIGPGGTNAITGVAQAYYDSSPIFVISGQANSKLLQYTLESGIRQAACQCMPIESVVATITKYCKTIMDEKQIISVMDDAYKAAMTGRKGPVWIDVPIDIQNRQIPDEILNDFKPNSDINCLAKDGDLLDEEYANLVSLLEKAEKPLILAGHGVRASGAVDLVELFSSQYSIPIVTSRGGIDVIESENPLFIGRPGGYGDRASHFAIQQCDWLLILGSRLSVSTIGYYPERLAQHAVKIMIDIDKKELERDAVPIDYKYCQDIKIFMKGILNQLKKQPIQKIEKHQEWAKNCLENKMKYPVVMPEYRLQSPLNSYYFTSVLSEEVSENSNIVVDTGSVYCIVSQSWKIKKGQRYLASGGFSCMGSWATALGTIQPEREIIVLSGDGSTQMNIQEFATLKYYKLPIKLFVYNNHGYMLIRHNQHNYMNDRFLGVGPDCGVETPDFCAVANAYGVKSVRITAQDDIVKKIKEVLSATEPVVCEVMVQEFAEIIPKISSRVMPDGSLKAAEFEDLYPFLEE